MFALGGLKRGYATTTMTPERTVGTTLETRMDAGMEDIPRDLRRFRKVVNWETRTIASPTEAEVLRQKKYSQLQYLAWDFFLTEGCPEDPDNRDFLITYMTKDWNPTNAKRLVDMVEAIPLEERSRACWDGLVYAHLSLGNEPAAFNCLVWLKENLETISDHGFERYIVWHISRGRWDYVLRSYALLRSTRTKEVTDAATGEVVTKRQTNRMQLQNFRMEMYDPDYSKHMLPWVMALPAHPKTRLEKIKDELGLELVRGWCWVQCSFTQYWTPEYQEVWDWMTSQKRWRNAISSIRWENAILNAARAKKWGIVRRLWDDWTINDKPRKISIYTLNYAIEAFVDTNDKERVLHLIETVWDLAPNKRPGRRTYQVLMEFLGSLGETERTEKLFDQYCEIYPVDHPSQFYGLLQAYNKLTENKFASVEYQVSIDTLILWFMRMQDEYGVEPDRQCYNILIQGVARSNDVDVTMAWFKQMVDKKFMPNRDSLDAIFEVFGNHGHWESAEQLLVVMMSKNLPRTTAMYKNLARAYQKHGDVEVAYQVLQRMEDDLRVSATPVWNAVISGFLDIGDTERAREVFLELTDKGLKFDETTYAISMHWILLVKDMQTVEQISERLWRLGRPVSINAYLNIMISYIKTGNPEAACETFMTILDRGLKPSIVALSLFMQAYGSMAQVPRADLAHRFDRELCELMCNVILQEEERKIPAWIMNQMLEINYRRGVLSNSLKLFQKFHNQTYRQTNMKYWSQMMVVFKQVGDLEGLREMYDSFKKSCRRKFFDVGGLRAGKKKVLRTYRYYMSHPLRVLMEAMIATTQIDIPVLEAEMQELRYYGYEFDNECINTWIQCLALSGNPLYAAKEFEKHLTQDWQNYRIYLRYQQRPRGPEDPDLVFDPRSSHRRPFSATISTIATEVDGLSRRRWQGDAAAEKLLGEISDASPHLLEAFRMFDDMAERIDRTLLYRLSRLQDIETHQREVADRTERDRIRNITPPDPDAIPENEMVYLRAPLGPLPPSPPEDLPIIPSAHPPIPGTGNYIENAQFDLLRSLYPHQEEERYYTNRQYEEQRKHMLSKVREFTKKTVDADLHLPDSWRKRPLEKKERLKIANERVQVGLSAAATHDKAIEGLQILEHVRRARKGRGERNWGEKK